MNRTAQQVALWTVPVIIIGIFFGWAFLAGFIPPQPPTDDAQQIAAWFQEHRMSIRVGMFIASAAVTLFVPWAMALTVQLKAIEHRHPVLTYTQVAAVALAICLFFFGFLVWSQAAYRDYAPETVQMLHDFGWYLFLFTWSPFTLWLVTVGLAIFMDRRPSPAFPRWLGWYSIWVGILLVPAGLMPFFKTGPFAYNGLFALYVPLVVFFVWVCLVTYFGVRNAGLGESGPLGHAQPAEGRDEPPVGKRPVLAGGSTPDTT